MNRYLMAAGWFSGFIAVALGAYGAHLLKTESDPTLYNRFLTGSKYHFYHTVVLIISLNFLPEKKNLIAGTLFLSGIFIFCGSIYLNTIAGMVSITKITPLGGILLMLGWIYSGVAVLQIKE